MEGNYVASLRDPLAPAGLVVGIFSLRSKIPNSLEKFLAIANFINETTYVVLFFYLPNLSLTSKLDASSRQ